MMTENSKVKTAETEVHNNYKRVCPYVDIFESENDVLLVADMPGVTKEDLIIQVIDGKLEISGVRNLGGEDKQIWQEFENVEYATAFKLSKEIDGTGATAELNDGVLKLRLARVEGAKAQVIKVQ